MISTRIAWMMALVMLALGGCMSYPPALAAPEYIATAERSPEGAYNNPISVSINLQALRKSSEPVVAQLAEFVQNLSAGFAALRSDAADLKDRQSGPVTFRTFGGSGGFMAGVPLAVRTFVVTGDSPSRRQEERRV